MSEHGAGACCTSQGPGEITCDKSLCKCTKTCGGNDLGSRSEGKLPGCDVSFILKPFDPIAQLQSCTIKPSNQQRHPFIDQDDVSTTSSTKTVHRLKLEVEIHTEDLQEPRLGVSMTSLIRWNIEKVVERNPDIDLKKALSVCQEKLELEPRTGRYRLPRSLASDEASDDRHICCALLAWQAKGENNFNRLLQLAERIKREKEMEHEICITDPCKATKFSKGLFNAKVTEAYRCEDRGRGVGYIGHTCAVPAEPASSCRSPPLAASGAKKKFYESIAGPVFKLPDSCPCSIKATTTCPPENTKEEEVKPEKLDIPSCLEGRCMDRLRTLDKALASLRERAARLLKREGERAKLLQRAEKAWSDMEEGFHDQLQLAAEEEETITERLNKLMEERNSYKCQCVQEGAEIDETKERTLAAQEQLASATEAARANELERNKLEKLWRMANKNLNIEKNQAAKAQRELMFSEEQLRQREKTVKDELASQRLQSRDVERTLRGELESLRDQFNAVADTLLKTDDQNKLMKKKLVKLKEKKNSILASLEACRVSCEAAYSAVQNELLGKNHELEKAKSAVVECACKLPKEASCQVRRTPSFAAVCRCSNRQTDENCSCTSLRTRLMSDLLRDLFTGLKEEMAEGSATMSCELLKCLDEDHNWEDKRSPVKQKLSLYFAKLVQNELDIAITTAIEHYHARYTSESCVDKARSGTHQKNAVVLRAEPMLLASHQPSELERDEGLVVAEGEAVWKRTQAEVCELSVQLQQLKRESVRRRDLKIMERNLTKIVQNVAKPHRSIETETSDLQPSEFCDIHVSNKSPHPVNIPIQDPKHMKRTCSPKNPIIKLKSSSPSTKLASTKYLREIPKERLQIHLNQSYTNENLPSLTSTDLYLSPRIGSPQKQISSQFSNLINSVSLECDASSNPIDVPAAASKIEHNSVKNLFTVATSKKLHKAMINKKKSPCTSYYQCSSDVKPPIRRIHNRRIGTEPLNIKNNTNPCSENLTQTTNLRKSAYNELVSECMRSYTMEKLLLEPSERTLVTLDNEYIIHENDITIYKKDEAIVNLLSVRTSDRANHTCARGTGSLASWKTAQSKDEDITSVAESVYFSNTSTAISRDLRVLNAYIYDCSGKTEHSLKSNDIEKNKKSKVLFKNKDLVKMESEIVSIVDFVEENECSNNNIQGNQSRDTAEKSLTGVTSKIYKSMTSIFVAQRADCGCGGEFGPYTERLREEKQKFKRESEERSKFNSSVANKEIMKQSNVSQTKTSKSKRPRGDSAGPSRKSVTSLKSQSSDKCCTKSKYHKYCLVETPHKSAISKKKTTEQYGKNGNKKTQMKCVQYDRNIIPSIIKSQPSSSQSKDDQNQNNLNRNRKPSLNEKIKTNTNEADHVEKVCGNQSNLKQRHNFTPCLCDFKTLGAMLIRDQNASHVSGGDRFGVGPFRGIFANDQQPMGAPAAYGIDCTVQVEKDHPKSSAAVQYSDDKLILSEHTNTNQEQRASLSSSHRESFICEKTLCFQEPEIEQKEQSSNLEENIFEGNPCVASCATSTKSVNTKSQSVCQSNEISEANDCKCHHSAASATIQTNGTIEGDSPSTDECACCSTENKGKNNIKISDLGVNAFHLLEKYIQCKIKKLKCKCGPHEDQLLNEEAVFSAMLDKIQGLISTDISRIACHCREQFEIENCETMAFSLLEEYIRSKIDEMKCCCAGSNTSVCQDLCASTLAGIKDVINNDLAEITCFCKTALNESDKESERPITQSRGVSGQNFFDKIDAVCSCDISKRPSGNKDMTSIGICTSKQNRVNEEDNKISSANLKSGIQIPGVPDNQMSINDKIDAIRCKCAALKNEEQKQKNASIEVLPSSETVKEEDLKLEDELSQKASKHSEIEELGKSVSDTSKRPSINENMASIEICTSKEEKNSEEANPRVDPDKQVSTNDKIEEIWCRCPALRNEKHKRKRASNEVVNETNSKINLKTSKGNLSKCRCSALKNGEQKLKNASNEMLTDKTSKRNLSRCCSKKALHNSLSRKDINENLNVDDKSSLLRRASKHSEMGDLVTSDSMLTGQYVGITLGVPCTCSSVVKNGHSKLVAIPCRSSKVPYIGLTLGCTCKVDTKLCSCSNKEDNTKSTLKHEKSLVKFEKPHVPCTCTSNKSVTDETMIAAGAAVSKDVTWGKYESDKQPCNCSNKLNQTKSQMLPKRPSS